MSDDKVIKLGAGTAWVWPLPREGELVPDYPPQSLEVRDFEITYEDDDDDDVKVIKSE